jgi:hypothetical protein
MINDTVNQRRTTRDVYRSIQKQEINKQELIIALNHPHPMIFI